MNNYPLTLADLPNLFQHLYRKSGKLDQVLGGSDELLTLSTQGLEQVHIFSYPPAGLGKPAEGVVVMLANADGVLAVHCVDCLPTPDEIDLMIGMFSYDAPEETHND